MSPSGVDPVEPLRRVLLPPLRFAAKNRFAGLARLKGLPALVERALADAKGADESVREELARLAAGFDEEPLDERKARVTRALSLLEGSPSPSPVEKPSPSPSPSPIKKPSPVKKEPSPKPPRAAPKNLPANPPTPADEVLYADVATLKGVGPRRAEVLKARGIHTVADVLAVIPRLWEDRRHAGSLRELTPGTAAVATGEVLASGQIGGGRGKRWEVLLDDGSGRLKLVFFRFSPFDMKKRFLPGSTLTAYGEVQSYTGNLQMVHPRVVQGAQAEEVAGVWPVYPEVGGLHPLELARAARAAVDRLCERPPEDPLPAAVREAAKAVGLVEAWSAIHAPADGLSAGGLKALAEHTHPAFRRLAFEELFALQLAMALRRRAGAAEPAVVVDGAGADELARELLPFELTGAQRRATEEVFRDLERGEPMGRLLQGDVGAGKTAVAALAFLRAARAGCQAAIMAPTELLAEQHRRTLTAWLEPLGVKVAYVTGSLRGKARREATARLASGEAAVAIGTHALLSEDVRFHRLALCVIDEQHRFGVEQRVGLKQKGPEDDEGRLLPPHLLVMTATPIPRSLALTYYGDLQVSVLDELPPGRTPVKTRVLEGRLKVRAVEAIEAALGRGERAYVVYPLIEESEKLDLKDATQGFEELSKRLGEGRVALVHGRMPAEERAGKMQAFAKGEVQVLVSTTVIEVGVDVPEASCMVVANAERFGLSQLHQLRGRVGRGQAKSECWLLAGSGGEDARRRLSVMEETNDGFKIADEDLAIRGPGDFLGTRQSGLPTLLFSDFAKHAELIELARQLASEVVGRDPELSAPEHRGLRDLVQRRFADRLALTAAG